MILKLFLVSFEIQINTFSTTAENFSTQVINLVFFFFINFLLYTDRCRQGDNVSDVK